MDGKGRSEQRQLSQNQVSFKGRKILLQIIKCRNRKRAINFLTFDMNSRINQFKCATSMILSCIFYLTAPIKWNIWAEHFPPTKTKAVIYNSFFVIFSETLLHLNDTRDDDISTDAGSSNGDITNGPSLVDPSNVFLSREKTIISRVLDELTKWVSNVNRKSYDFDESLLRIRTPNVLLYNANFLFF